MSLDSNATLLPCPFCGTAPTLEETGNDHTKKRSITVKCPKCRAQQTNGAIRFGMDWLRKVAIDGWNARSQPSEWVATSERMPEEGQDCLVLLCWDDQQPYIGIDTWRMGSERPLEFSSATIETGMEWAEHDYDEISHWMPLPSPPQSPMPKE